MKYAEVVNRFTLLAHETEKPNWDGEHAPPTQSIQWSITTMLVLYCKDHAVALPWITVCGDGEVHLQWSKRNGDRVVITIGRINEVVEPTTLRELFTNPAIFWNYIPRVGESHVVEVISPVAAFAKVRHFAPHRIKVTHPKRTP